jgi:hypothetical protein
MSGVGQLLVVLVVMLVLTVAAAVGLGVYFIRRLGRGLRRSLQRSGSPTASGHQTTGGIAASPRSVITDRAATYLLHARCWLPTRTRRIDLLRVELRRDVDTACGAVDAGLRAGRPVEELRPACRYLRQAAAHVDLDLLVIGAEPDPVRREAMLGGLDERRRMISEACAQLRHAVLLTSDPAADPLLAQIVDDLRDEMNLLRLRAEAYRELAAGKTG